MNDLLRIAPVKLSHLGVKNLINLLMLEKGLPSILYYDKL